MNKYIILKSLRCWLTDLEKHVSDVTKEINLPDIEPCVKRINEQIKIDTENLISMIGIEIEKYKYKIKKIEGRG